MEQEAREASGIQASPGRRPRIFYGWWIVLTSFLADFVGTGATAYSFGIFYKPMSQEFGWSRSMTAGAVTLRSIVAGVSGPVIGPLVDRFGPRLIMPVSALVVGASIMALSRINGLTEYYLFYGIIGALGMVGEGGLVTQTTVAKWFIRMRGRATAFTTMGVSISGMVFTPISTFLVGSYGWRLAWVVLGALQWLVTAPLAAIFMRRQPEDMGLRPDGDDPEESSSPPTPQARSRPAVKEEQVWTLQAALRSASFWLLLIGFNLGGVSISAVLLHQIPYMTDKGFSPATAAAVVTLYAFLAAASKLIWGFIAERVQIRYVNFICFAGGGVGILILAQAGTVPVLFAYAVVYGMTRGAYVLLSPLTWADYFGRSFIGTIRGMTAPFSILTTAGGQLMAAAVYDVTKSYDIAFFILAGTLFVGAFFMFLAKPPRLPGS